MSSEILDAALTYAASGFRVFPLWSVVGGRCACGLEICEHPGKHPMATLVPRGKLDATSDPAIIRAWFLNAPLANLGLETEQSGLVVLDVDPRHGGKESLSEFDSELSTTLTVVTGGGGLHAYYLRPPELSRFPSQQAVRPGIDLVGNGYVVAPPSLHISGQRYRWANNAPIVQLPSVLRGLKKPTASIVTLNDSATTPVVEGGRNNSLFRLGAALRSTAIGYDAVRAALHLENRRRFSPPLPDDEVDQVAAKVLRHAKVTRDVAIGAVVEDNLAQLVGKETSAPAVWIRDVAVEKSIPARFYSTGSAQLDVLLGGGFGTSMVTGIIGPPSTGKSSFVTTLTLELQKYLPVLSISTELTRPDLMKRVASVVKGWHWRDAIKGKYDEQYLGAVADLQIKLTGTDELDVADPTGFIVREALAIREETGHMPAVILDYLQQLAGSTDDSTRSRVGELTLKLRKLSQLLDTVVVAVFTTSREFYSPANIAKLRIANDPIAYLRAAKESGDIEYHCANLMYLDVDQSKEGQPKPARVVVARARVGEPGFAGYRAHLDVGRWVPDALAAPEVQIGGSQKVEAQRKIASIDEEMVVTAVRKTPGKVWNEYRDVCGIARARAQSAYMRLMSSGQLVETVQETHDANHRVIRKRIVSVTK